MKRYKLAQHGIAIIDGQKNKYYSETRKHQRSYLCVCMKKTVFAKIQPCLANYGVLYLTQTNTAWDIRVMKDKHWVTKVHQVGTVCIELLEEEITIEDDEIYVVMWNARFLPKFISTGRYFDVDNMLLDILEGKRKPIPYILRIIGCMFFKR